VQTNLAYTPLNHLGLLQIAGVDAEKFLQGQLTCDVNEVTESSSALGAHCNPQGKIISLFRIFSWQNAFYLQLSREMVEPTKQALAKYAVFFKVSLTNISEDFFQYGVINQFDYNWPEKPNQQLTTNNQVIIRELGSPSRWIIISKTAEPNQQPSNITIEQWRAIDLANHQPLIYPETSAKFFSHELCLNDLSAINFNKGCYTGQEIIARMHYRGKTKTQLIQTTMNIKTKLIRGQDLIDDNNQTIILVDLCWLNDDFFQLLVIAPLKVSI